MNTDSKQKPSPREDRVAAALRENLRKRKQQGQAQSRLREAQSSRASTQACAVENDDNKDAQ
ncbi:MAG: hypothetical protein WCD70_11320 [Alphaproteobacteria bacterium]